MSEHPTEQNAGQQAQHQSQNEDVSIQQESRPTEDNNTPPDVSMSEEPTQAVGESPPKRRTRRQYPGRNLPKTSCMRCKDKKMKCDPSENQEGICRRCEKGHHECHYQVPEQKPRTSRLTRRIEYLEQSINHIKNFAPGDVPPQHLNDSGPLLPRDDFHPNENRIDRLEQTLLQYTYEVESQKPQNQVTSGVATYARDSPQNNSGQESVTNRQLQDPSARSYIDVIDQGILDLRYALVLLNEFIAMSQNFPYVIIPQSASVHTLRRDSPMLLLAICASAAWRDRGLQSTLEKAYLNVLAAKMVVDAEQSLDMLQSLLVHLSWCHFHLKSSYRLSSFAISLVINLGINRRPNNRVRRKLGVALNFPLGNRPFSNNTEIWSAEARRAYIGCYVICTSYSHALRKVSTLKYTPYLEESALSLRRESTLPSDDILIHYVRLIHHAENICDTFDYDSTHSLPPFPDEQLQFYVRSFNTTLGQIQSQIPQFFTKNTMLSTYVLLVSAYTHEIGLHGLSAHPAILSIQRTTILIDCLGAVKRVLEAVANLSDVDFRTLLGFNWARIHYTLSLAIELSLGFESPSWSVDSVRNIVALEMYIDVFVRRLEQHSELVHKKEGEGDWFSFLAAQWLGLRRSYVDGMRKRGVVVLAEEGRSVEGLTGLDGWLGLGDMDFMPNEWFWMAPDGGI